LNHEAFNVPMEQTTVIIAGSAQRKKVLNVEVQILFYEAIWCFKLKVSCCTIGHRRIKITSATVDYVENGSKLLLDFGLRSVKIVNGFAHS
ncbi:hypothetical protein T05_4081, partial [Trichinella murrelli]